MRKYRRPLVVIRPPPRLVLGLLSIPQTHSCLLRSRNTFVFREVGNGRELRFHAWEGRRGKDNPNADIHGNEDRRAILAPCGRRSRKILGHADYGTTSNIYVHTDIDALVAAAEAVVKKKSMKK